ncbi:Uncharacterized protein FKW44_008081 [Caligus rogercresseyi]|uniref:Uncharacterized protein n=1 Tax=Caligus rogercresseyi TaxID=217165 RepID=A0A7T8KFY4_CALRO|nr:Uncharacterized protein FKW44_008081 [Caligus rogercresseyi]
MFASFRAGRSLKEVIEFFNYPKSNVYDQWKAWNSLKKNDLIAKSVLGPWGHHDRRVCHRGEEKVNEDGNKSYAKLAAEMGCSKQTIANTIYNDLGYSSYKKRHRMILTEGTRSPGGQGGTDLRPPSPDCNILDYFFWGMVETKTNKHAHNTLDSLRAAIWRSTAHRLEMIVAA